MPSENVVKWYGGVVQAAPASEVKYIVPAFQCSQLRQLLLQSSSPGRCGIKSDCCCGSKDVAASHSHTVVAATETLQHHICILLLRQQRRCSVTFAHCCCGSRDVAASNSQTAVAAAVRAIASYELCLTCAGVIECCKRQLLRLIPRRALWPNVALKKPNGTLLRPRSKSLQLWPELIGL